MSEQSFDPNSLFKQPAISLPCRLFETMNRMDEYSAEDMRYGDVSESRLKSDFNLRLVSALVDPYSGEKMTASRYDLNHWAPRPLSVKERTDILFDEFRDLSTIFSFTGPYRDLIKKLITHMQIGNGKLFSSHLLDSAYKEQIVNDSSENSSLLIIKNTLTKFINWELGQYDSENKHQFTRNMAKMILPKFNRWVDRINSLTISVHDVWATHITLKSLVIKGNHYSAIFRLWFVLQHYNKFSFKPFITEMNATITITGNRYE
ncbi:DUF3289 family protein [Erwinia sp. MYb416]|uniref:DUF3289 family protein n=1 Tax=Erwinia sp. MYb416 TaxID=3108532 RepID=UPI00309C3C10